MTNRETLFFIVWGLIGFPLLILYLNHTANVIIAVLGYMGLVKYLLVKDANAP